jgi:sulfur carrier protein ThiS
MTGIVVDTWLYGNLARYGGKADQGSYANLQVDLPEGGTVGDLLAYLQMPSAERGITFINGELSAMPGIQPDLGHILHNGDRIAFFHLISMWPFQYRHGVPMIAEMSQAVQASEDQGLHHTYKDHDEKGA